MRKKRISATAPSMPGIILRFFVRLAIVIVGTLLGLLVFIQVYQGIPNLTPSQFIYEQY